MNKKIYPLLTGLFLFFFYLSCSKLMYYIDERNVIDNRYCTPEVSKEKTIYRSIEDSNYIYREYDQNKQTNKK